MVRFSALLAKHADELAVLMSAEMGKPVAHAKGATWITLKSTLIRPRLNPHAHVDIFIHRSPYNHVRSHPTYVHTSGEIEATIPRIQYFLDHTADIIASQEVRVEPEAAGTEETIRF